MSGSTGRTTSASSRARPMRSAPSASFRRSRPDEAMCHAAAPHPVETRKVRRAALAPGQCRDVGKKPSAPNRRGPVRAQPVLHGPGRDCPCSWPTPPESAAGRVPLSRIGSVPAHPRTAIAGFCVRWNGRSRGLWRSRPC